MKRCPQCNQIIDRFRFCSRKCAVKFHNDKKRVSNVHPYNPCIQCGIATKNPKFCSRSCAAKTNNEKIPKRKLTKPCDLCGTLVKSQQKRCVKCRPEPIKYWSIAQYKYKLGEKAKWPGYFSSRMREFSRKWGKDREKVCQNCNYAKHVEHCHKVPVSSFPDSATIWEVNCPENIVLLCPNCHWELDNGLLLLE